MNSDPKRIEEVNITVWSDNDDREVTYVATETDMDTGVFDAEVFLTTTDSSPGKRNSRNGMTASSMQDTSITLFQIPTRQ